MVLSISYNKCKVIIDIMIEILLELYIVDSIRGQNDEKNITDC